MYNHGLPQSMLIISQLKRLNRVNNWQALQYNTWLGNQTQFESIQVDTKGHVQCIHVYIRVHVYVSEKASKPIWPNYSLWLLD